MFPSLELTAATCGVEHWRRQDAPHDEVAGEDPPNGVRTSPGTGWMTSMTDLARELNEVQARAWTKARVGNEGAGRA